MSQQPLLDVWCLVGRVVVRKPALPSASEAEYPSRPAVMRFFRSAMNALGFRGCRIAVWCAARVASKSPGRSSSGLHQRAPKQELRARSSSSRASHVSAPLPVIA